MTQPPQPSGGSESVVVLLACCLLDARVEALQDAKNVITAVFCDLVDLPVQVRPLRQEGSHTLLLRSGPTDPDPAVTRQAATGPTGGPGHLWQFGDGEQHGCVLQGMQRVPPLGNDQQVTVAPFPLRGVSSKPHPTVQDLHGGLAGVFVFRHRRPGGQRDQCLPQHMLVPAVDGPCAPTGRSSGCRLRQLPSEGIKRQLLHTPNGTTQSRSRQRHLMLIGMVGVRVLGMQTDVGSRHGPRGVS